MALSKLLIANRGEIACRIARTCQLMGISTVGVYSEPDRNSLHVDSVDLAVALGGSSPADSYLHGDLIISAAVDSGATAIHPGYGFLSENADFAQAVIDAGLIWVGPTPDQIRLLGDKVAAKRAAISAGVPTTEITEAAPDNVPSGLTMPVLVKAASGGGGRGMRVVHAQSDLASAVEAASREATSAFGDGTVFIEPYIERGRHIEVQILGDTHGNVVHLGDRECSIQRRNQKVIEEAPSAGISEHTRRRLHDGALALARSVGYVGAGTVEFMVGDDGDEPTITFLEVNTRLQVEHPVTEAITGIDLVDAQLSVASGQPLPFLQEDIGFHGHAVEVRLVAEDPAAGWMPSTGLITEFEIDGDVRIDTGFRAGSDVSAEYDSLLAKVIAHAPSREIAASRIGRAMRTARVVGVATNAAMLAATMVDDDYREGATFTSYLADHPHVEQASGPVGDDRLALLLGGVFADELTSRDADDATGFAPSGWRNLRTRGQRRTWLLRGDVHTVEYRLSSDRATVTVGPPPEINADGSLPADERVVMSVYLIDRSPSRQVIEIDGRRHVVDVRFEGAGRSLMRTASPLGSLVWERGESFVDHDEVVAGGGPVCPLPGTVIAVHVAQGDEVTEGQLLMVVEAMKMEHQIVAGGPSTVAEVRYAVGDRVDTGDLLVALEHADDPAE